MTNKSTPGKRRVRRGRVVAALAVLVIAAAVVALIALRATIVAAVLKDRLAAMGLGQVELRVAEVGLTRARITDVRAGWVLKIAEIAVGYSLGDLARGRVATVDVGGLALDVSAIEEWRGSARPATPALSAAFPALRLRDGRVVGAFPWGSFEVAVAGTTAPDGAATLAFQEGRALVRIADRRLEFADGAGTVAVDAGGAARLVLTNGRLHDGRRPALFPPLRLQGDLALAGDALEGRLAAEGEDFGRLRLEGAVNVARGEAAASVFLDDVSIAHAGGAVRGATGVVRLERLGPPAEFAIHLDRARAEAAGRALAIEDVTARATVALAGTAAVAADIETAVVAGVSPLAVPPLRLHGRVEWRPDMVTFRAGARPRAAPASAPVTVAGAHDLGRGRGEARLTAPSLALGPDGVDLPALVPGLEWIQSLTGTVAGEARLIWGDDGLDGSGRVELNDVSLATRELWIEAVSGAIQFDRLRPPSAVTAPELRARLVSAGVVFEAPSVRLRLEPAGSGVRLRVERAETGWAGARFVLKDAILDPAAETQRLVLELFKADLATLFRLLDIEGVRGQGVLNGRVAVAVGKDSVAIEDGRLDAEGGGVLEVRSAAVRRALAQGGETSALLVRALENFHYKRLSVTFQGADDAATARLSVEGANPDVLGGHPFVVNVNLTGNLGRVLRAILDGYRLSNRAIRATVGKGR
jgi:hypothetical protein